MRYNYLDKEADFKTAHPLINFIYILAMLITTMLTMNIWVLLASFIMSVIVNTVIFGIRRQAWHLLAMLPLVAFTILVQGLFSRNGTTVLFYINDNAVTQESFIFGAVISLMLVSVMQWCMLFRVFLDSDRLLYIFGKIIPTIGLTFSMILRFIPLFMERYRQIHTAQLGMGHSPENMGLIGKIKLFAKEISVLIVWSLESSIDTADSMEARGYGLKGRKSYNIYRFTAGDGMLLCLEIIVLIIIVFEILVGNISMFYLPSIVFSGSMASVILVVVLLCGLGLLPVLFKIKGAVKWHYLNSKI